MKLLKSSILLLLVGCFFYLWGCATVPPVQPQAIVLRCNLPSFAPLLETKEQQEKGGIQISLAPVSYECQRSTVQKIQDVSPSFSEQMHGAIRVGNEKPKERFVERSLIPVVSVIPENLRFRITVSNKLPRVFRGAGLVVQFNVAGKLVSVDQNNYAELSNLIVAPRTEQQVEIIGPSLTSLPDQTTIGVFLYDVVTKTDQAGNITEKQNFEWFYNYAVQVHEETGTIQKTRGWI